MDRIGRTITVDPKTGCWLAPDWMPSNGGGYATFRVCGQDWLAHLALDGTFVAEKINEAWERVVASDVRYRFVIDTSTL